LEKLVEQPIDEYKFHVESDVDYFGKLNIYYCDKCDFGFSLSEVNNVNNRSIILKNNILILTVNCN
jgi:hypothetical protein